MECHWTFQRIPGLCPIHSTYRQQSTDIHAENIKFGLTGHRWVWALTSYEFTLEYQKGSDNAAADMLSWVPVRHDKDTVRSLLEGAVTGTTERGEVLISQPLRVEHDCLNEELQACTLKLAPMHVTNWEEAQGEDVLLAACHKWMSMIGTVYRNYHRSALIVIFIFPGLLPKILWPSSQEHTCLTWTMHA